MEGPPVKCLLIVTIAFDIFNILTVNSYFIKLQFGIFLAIKCIVVAVVVFPHCNTGKHLFLWSAGQLVSCTSKYYSGNPM